MDSAGVELADLDGLSVAELKALLREQHAALQDKHAQLVAQDALLRSYTLEIEAPKLQIIKLRRLQFGSRSEKRAREIEQLELWVEELEAAATQRSSLLAEQAGFPPAPSIPKPRREFPAHLARETKTIAPHESSCPDCGGELKHLGDDVCEILELEPVRFKVICEVRPKLACASCDTIVQAPAPTRPIDRGMAGPGLLAHVVVGKYGDHVPLYRQAEIYARQGVELDRSLLAQWVGNVSALLTPLTNALREHVLAAGVVHADDTPIPVLAPGLGKTKTGQLWTYVRDERPAGGQVAPAVWFAYSADRKGANPQEHLQDFAGILQADGYAGYSKIYDGGRVIEAACWAHYPSPVLCQENPRDRCSYHARELGRTPHKIGEGDESWNPIRGRGRLWFMNTRPSGKSSDVEHVPGAATISRIWRADRSISEASARGYLQWIARFRRYCGELGLVEADELTEVGTGRFKAWLENSRRIDNAYLGRARSSLRALRRVYEVMGSPMPPWGPIECQPPPVVGVLREYATHLTRHRGNPEASVRKMLYHIGKLLDHLVASGKSLRQMRLPDIDAFLIRCAQVYSRATVADIASSVRSFLRFLLVSGRIDLDLADAVISPVKPKFERPPRALPWEDVQRLLRAVDRSTARGLRDHALLLMMSTYGLGAGEVIRLQLHDIDWSAGTLHITRPKTGVNFVLPLLPAVGKVLARYLRHGRPSHTPTRHVFVQMKVPFGALTASSAVRHALVKHAKAAGIEATFLGSHVLRHSNAARQLEVGTKARTLSELLGHRDPQSLSAYVRIATQPLREVSLPVPR